MIYYHEGYLSLVFQQRALRAEATVAKLKEEVNILKVIFMADCDPFYIHLKIQSIKRLFLLFKVAFSQIVSAIYEVKENLLKQIHISF